MKVCNIVTLDDIATDHVKDTAVTVSRSTLRSILLTDHVKDTAVTVSRSVVNRQQTRLVGDNDVTTRTD